MKPPRGPMYPAVLENVYNICFLYEDFRATYTTVIRRTDYVLLFTQLIYHMIPYTYSNHAHFSVYKPLFSLR